MDSNWLAKLFGKVDQAGEAYSVRDRTKEQIVVKSFWLTPVFLNWRRA